MSTPCWVGMTGLSMAMLCRLGAVVVVVVVGVRSLRATGSSVSHVDGKQLHATTAFFGMVRKRLDGSGSERDQNREVIECVTAQTAVMTLRHVRCNPESRSPVLPFSGISPFHDTRGAPTSRLHVAGWRTRTLTFRALVNCHAVGFTERFNQLPLHPKSSWGEQSMVSFGEGSIVLSAKQQALELPDGWQHIRVPLDPENTQKIRDAA